MARSITFFLSLKEATHAVSESMRERQASSEFDEAVICASKITGLLAGPTKSSPHKNLLEKSSRSCSSFQPTATPRVGPPIFRGCNSCLYSRKRRTRVCMREDASKTSLMVKYPLPSVSMALNFSRASSLVNSVMPCVIKKSQKSFSNMRPSICDNLVRWGTLGRSASSRKRIAVAAARPCGPDRPLGVHLVEGGAVDAKSLPVEAWDSSCAANSLVATLSNDVFKNLFISSSKKRMTASEPVLSCLAMPLAPMLPGLETDRSRQPVLKDRLKALVRPTSSSAMLSTSSPTISSSWQSDLCAKPPSPPVVA
mmetsp:Transcript_60730/g.169793  ORF Transcript_60730/g.169793 Transcript_60730/m.169793 type:complete len:311 (+) Transcript_60730:444-1376(+)